MQTDKFQELCRLATHGGSLEEVQSLLRAGVDINRKNCRRVAPLLLASHNNHKNIVELLIKSGADIRGCYYGKKTMVHFAFVRGCKAIEDTLVEEDADVNSRDWTVRTPFKEHKDLTVELLVNCGADVTVFNTLFKRTVLHYASYRGWKEIAESLVEKGADVDASDFNNDTPLHLAIESRAFDVVSVLLKAGADSNRENKQGKSPFLLLLWLWDVDRIKLAIEMGAYLDSYFCYEGARFNIFKSAILVDVELCTRAILNEFNRNHLPKMYEMYATKQLPLMDRLRIGSGSWQALQVKEAVNRDMRRRGYCDLFDTRPLVLSMLCVRQLYNYTQEI